MCNTFSALTFLLFGNENQNDDINISFKSANWCCSTMSHLFNNEPLFKKKYFNGDKMYEGDRPTGFTLFTHGT